MGLGAVHFVGFRGEEYWSAVAVWGRPSFIHMGWDIRAAREIAAGDVVVFARGEHDQAPRLQSFSDTVECSRLEQLSDRATAVRAR